MLPQKNPPVKQARPSVKEDRLARSFNEYEEKNKEQTEKMKQRRVDYVIKDLPIY